MFNIANVLNRFCDMVERSQVFNLWAVEKDLSGVVLVAPLTRSNFKILMTFGIRRVSSFRLLISLNKSAGCCGLVSFQRLENFHLGE